MFKAHHFAHVFERAMEVIRLSNGKGIMLQVIPNKWPGDFGVVLTITEAVAKQLRQDLDRELDPNHHYAGKDDEK